MDRRKSFEDMAVYLRGLRPTHGFVEFDRMVRTVLFWFDTHKIKEPAVFLAKEGKEYQSFLLAMGPEYTPPTDEFLASMMRFSSSTR